MRELKRYFQPKVDKAAVAGSSRGHISAASTDPHTPDPPDKQHFLSQALFALVSCSFPHKASKVRVRRSPQMVLICAFVSCQYAIFLVLFLYMISNLYCAWRCEKYIGKIKIYTDYAFKWKGLVVRRFLFSLLGKCFVFEETDFAGSTEFLFNNFSGFLKTGFNFVLTCQSFCAICRLVIFCGKRLFLMVTSMWSHMDLQPPVTKHTNAPNVHCMGKLSLFSCLRCKSMYFHWYRINLVFL